MGDFLGRKKLDMLRTKHYYYYFDKEMGSCEDDHSNDKAKEILRKHPELEDISEKILKAICYVRSKSKTKGFNNDICGFLYYWIGDQILKDLTKKQFFGEIMLTLFKSLNEGDTHEICDYHYYNIHKDNFNNIKLIFDYSEDYNSYEKQIIGHNPPCNQDYKQYLQTYVDSYITFNNKCNVEGLNDNYCEAFRKYFDGKDANLLSTWTCDLKKDDPRDLDLGDEGEDQEEQKTVDETLKGMGKFPSRIRIGSQDVQSDHEFSSIRASRLGHFRSAAPGLDTETSLMGRPSSPPDSSSPSIASKSITGAVSVAGILVPSYLMYNYTYAGTCINKVLGKKTRTNFNPYTDQFLMANFSGPENLYSEINRYNISYSPE
ncbi:Plasmodium vivax Vir protein, putative [Plasmodium vivax]|nr:Plasmodium vivax Vir protein, putative [Plasmodium vivax]